MIEHPEAILPRVVTQIPKSEQARTLIVDSKHVQETLKRYPSSAR